MANVVDEFHDPRIRLFRQATNIGGFANFEFVLAQAKGDYFMWAADDDGWEPDFISELLAAFKPSAIVSFCNYVKYAESGEVRGKIEITAESCELGLREILDKVFSLKKINVAIYGLFRREALQSLLKKGLPKHGALDRILFAYIALSGQTVVLSNKYLHKRVVHKGTYSSRHGGVKRGKAVNYFIDIVVTMEYYLECLKVLCIYAKDNDISDLWYYLRKFCGYVVIVESITLQVLPRILSSLLRSLKRLCLRGVKKCLA